jgi:hypothetical protein
VGVGSACTLYEPAIVLEALCMTAAITLGLTAYTFHAARKGHSFQWMGPMLFTGDCPTFPLSCFTIRGSRQLSQDREHCCMNILGSSGTGTC